MELLLAISAVESKLRTFLDGESGDKAFYSAQKTARELVVLCRAHEAHEATPPPSVQRQIPPIASQEANDRPTTPVSQISCLRRQAHAASIFEA